MKKPQSHSTKTVFKNEWIAVNQDTLYLPSTSSFSQTAQNSSIQADRYDYTYVVKTRPGVIVVPYFTQSDSLLLVSQYRHPIQRTVLGFPGGSMQKDAQQTAHNELVEETGYKTDQLADLGEFIPDVGILADIGHVFVAIDPQQVTQPLHNSPQEFTQPIIKSVDEIKQLVYQGKIRDGWTLGPFFIFLLWKEHKGSIL